MSDRNGAPPPRYISNFLVAGGLIAILTLVWHSSSVITSLQDAVAGLSHQIVANYDATNQTFGQKLTAMDARVTALETARGAIDQQMNQTTSSIAVLQTQMSSLQDSIHDMNQGVRSIQNDIGTMARTANAPLPRK